MSRSISSSLPKCLHHPEKTVSYLCIESNCLTRFLCEACLCRHSESYKIISIKKEFKKYFFEDHSDESITVKMLEALKAFKDFVLNTLEEWKNKFIESITQLEEYALLYIP